MGKNALVLIDVWIGMNPEWDIRAKKVIENGIKPLLEWAREKGFLIVHHYWNSELGYPNVLDVHPGELEKMPNPNWLRINGYTTLFYAGFATNECLLNKGKLVGTDRKGANIYIQNGGIKHMAKEGFDIIVVREATLGVHENLDRVGHVTKKALLKIERNYGKVVSFKELIKNEKDYI